MRDPKEPETRLLVLAFSSEYPLNPTEIRKIAQVEIPRIHKYMKNDLKDFVKTVVVHSGRMPKEKGHVRDSCMRCFEKDKTRNKKLGPCKELTKKFYYIEDGNVEGKKEAIGALHIMKSGNPKFFSKMLNIMSEKRKAELRKSADART